MVADAAEKYGRLECAFNNAGIEGEGGQTHQCTEADLNRVIAIDLTGVWLCRRPRLCRCSSRAAVVPSSTRHTRGGLVRHQRDVRLRSAKHGVAGLTRAAALE
jgi:NAD(P)-dependent dehydrogenase (short-subunit alcohol dehydrogenase family)